jgi:hypothetical protein
MPKAAEHTGAAEGVGTGAVPPDGLGDQPSAGERITVALIPAAAGNLKLLQERTNLSKTDIANRAITTYAFFDAQLKSGHDLILRDPRTGESQVVRFL